MTVARRFLLLQSVAFLFVVAFTGRLTVLFGREMAEGGRVASTLHETLGLTQRIGAAMEAQIARLDPERAEVDALSLSEVRRADYEIGEKMTRLLRLPIDLDERVAVERIRLLYGDFGVVQAQFYEAVRSKRLDRAALLEHRVTDLGRQIQARTDELLAKEVRTLDAVVTGLARSVRLQSFAVLGLAAGLVLLVAAVTIFLRRDVLEPIAAIRGMIDRVRLGDFSARTPVRRPDEVGELAQGFNFMASSLAESYGSLERKVEERTTELQSVQRQLVQVEKMSAVGQLVSGVSHELNNPLTAIIGFAELLQKDIDVRGSPSSREAIGHIATEAERCRRIVANLLQFARRQEPQRANVRINDVVERIVKMREYQFGTHGVSLVRDYDQKSPAVFADPYQLQQVALNLVNNAHDAIRELERPGTVVVKTRVENGRVVLEVRDDGPGIREPSRLFEPFYTTKEVGKGTGLGLAVCYGIVKEHGGEITAENTGTGAAFRVALPLGHDVEPAAPQPAPLPAAILPSRPRVALVVDDEPPLLRLQALYLAQLGVQASCVASGEEAIRLLEEGHNVDVIVSDVRMPGPIDGLKLYDWVRDHRPALVSRFLFSSGDQVTLASGGGAPANVIQKPFKLEDYARAIRSVLEEPA